MFHFIRVMLRRKIESIAITRDGAVTIHHDLDGADRHELASLPARAGWMAGEHKVDRVGMTFGKRAFDIVFALILLVPLSFVIVGWSWW